MPRKLLLILAAVVIAGSTYAHGKWTLRWTGTGELEAAASSVNRIPKEFGDWTSEDLRASQRTMEQAGAIGYISRRYDNRTGGPSVTVMLLCGRTGPLAAHLPTICLPASGMQLATTQKLYTLPRDESRNWGQIAWGDFRGTVGGEPLRTRLFWAWSADGVKWESPTYPRMALAGYPHLYKVFVQREMEPSESKDTMKRGSLDEEPCVLFLREFLAEVKKAARDEGRGERPSPKS